MPATSATETTREGLFASTRWTMVLDAGESQTPPAQALSALSELCRIYWRPIFLFLRRQGSNPHDAQSKILSIDGIDEADVQLVWDPPWNQNMISEAGRMKLGMV